MTGSLPVSFILVGLVSISTVSSIIPYDSLIDEDELESELSYFDTPVYVKRSVDFTPNEIERFSLLQEEDEGKRDLIKGPSVSPEIDGTETDSEDKEYVDQKSAEAVESRNTVDNFKQEAERSENVQKMSVIEGDDNRAESSDTDEGEKRSKGASHQVKKKRISAKERAELSEKLINLLYEFKRHKQAKSNAELSKTQSVEKGTPFSKKHEEIKEGPEEINDSSQEGQTNIMNDSEDKGHPEDKDKVQSKDSTQSDEKIQTDDKDLSDKGTSFNAPEDGAADTKGDSTDVEQTFKDKKDESTESSSKVPEEKDQGLLEDLYKNEDKDESSDTISSGDDNNERRESKSKSKGKINVLVNVNINERLVRNKISRAKKNRNKSINSYTYSADVSSGSQGQTRNYQAPDYQPYSSSYGYSSQPATNTATTTQGYTASSSNVAGLSSMATNSRSNQAFGYQPQSAYTNQNYYQTPYTSVNVSATLSSASSMTYQKPSYGSESSSDEDDEGSTESDDDEEEENVIEKGLEEEESSEESSSSGMKPKQEIASQPKQESSVTQRTPETFPPIFTPGAMQTVSQKNVADNSTDESRKEDGRKQHDEDDEIEAVDNSQTSPQQQIPVQGQQNTSPATGSQMAPSPSFSQPQQIQSQQSKDQNKNSMAAGSRLEPATSKIENSVVHKTHKTKMSRKKRKHPKNTQHMVDQEDIPQKVTNKVENPAVAKRPSEATQKTSTTDSQEVRKDTPDKQTPAPTKKLDFLSDNHDAEIRLLNSNDRKTKQGMSEPIVIEEVKNLNKEPKPNPKEATVENTTAEAIAKDCGKLCQAEELHSRAEAKPQNVPEEPKENETKTVYDNEKENKTRKVSDNEKENESRRVSDNEKTKQDSLSKVKGVEDSGKSKPETVAPTKEEKERQKDLGEHEITKQKQESTGEAEHEIAKEKQESTTEDQLANKNKYGSLSSVREKFKGWEQQMLAKLSNPFLKNDDLLSLKEKFDEEKESLSRNKAFKSWKEEEGVLLQHLKNPYLESEIKPKDQEGEGKKEGKENRNQGENEEEKEVENAKQVLITRLKELQKLKENQTATLAEIKDMKGKNQLKTFSPENQAREGLPSGDHQVEGNKLQELQMLKTQILNEVDKIDVLQEKYKKAFTESPELEKAKGVLKQDLNVIHQIEKKVQSQMESNKQGVQVFENNKHDKSLKELSSKLGKSLKVDMIPHPLKKKNDNKQHPLEKIHGLLQAEMMRVKNGKHKKGKDPQLENIRKLLKQELKGLLKTGQLSSVKHLPSKLQKLGNLIHKKIKAKKTKTLKHKKLGNGKAFAGILTSNIAGKQEPDLVEGWHKPTRPGSPNAKMTTPKAFNQAVNQLENKLKQPPSSVPVNGVPQNSSNATTGQPAAQINALPMNPPTRSQAVQNPNQPQNFPTKGQADQFKNLLQNLNTKIGEVYAKLAQQNTNGQADKNANGGVVVIHPPTAPAAPKVPNAKPNVPNVQQYVPFNAPVPPAAAAYAPPQTKHDMPENEEEAEEPEPDTVLAEKEPVETLIENLEKDITDVWSYKDVFPDANSIGLDNEKIHKTYVNLGSISGLNLRRALARALRGKDVGLAVVGGSISKGGPFSEKGVDYVLRTYFYAVADWWNKVIRPVTGSSMVLRDVSIGGIATDYYSYCLRSHLPDDKLTNIVLWELSANDMRRYADDELRPKSQPLEQFTRNVLSYKSKPALIFLNFFALFSWDEDLYQHCRNFQDEGEDEIAKYYKITSLSWRDMVCSLMKENAPLFSRDELFAEDQFHPSIEGHAQMAYIIIDYIRTEFLKNLVKQRFLEIGDAVRKLKIPKSVYVPRAMFADTYSWKPLCYTYMLVDNQSPNNSLSVNEEVNGDFRYTVLKEFKIRSDKIVGMDTKQKDQTITYRLHVPPHSNGDRAPYKRLAIMSFTDDRAAEVRFDNQKPHWIDTTKRFLEGTVLKYIATNVPPGEHSLSVKSEDGGFLVSAVMLA